MHTLLLVFEFLGTTELLVIAVVALILFGPRKLPEIGRTVGRGIAEFKRASDDFKRTWEYEVDIEQRRPADTAAAADLPQGPADVPALPDGDPAGAGEQTVARGATGADVEEGAPAAYLDADEGAREAADGSARARGRRADEDELNAS